MKKLTAIICALTLAAFSLCACGNNEGKNDEASAAASQTEQSSVIETTQADGVVGTWKLDASKVRELMTQQIPSMPEGATFNIDADGTLDMKADNTFTLSFNVAVQASVPEVSQAMDQKMQATADGTYTQNGSTLEMTATHTSVSANNMTSESNESSTIPASFTGSEIIFESEGMQLVFTR